MKDDNKNGFISRKVLVGLLAIVVSIGLGYGLFLFTKPYIQGKEKAEIAMNEQKGQNIQSNQEQSLGNNKNNEISIQDSLNTNENKSTEILNDASKIEGIKEGNKDTNNNTIIDTNINTDTNTDINTDTNTNTNTSLDSSNDAIDKNNTIITVGELIEKEIKKDLENKNNINELGEKPRIPTKVKGIYVTGPRAGSTKYMDDLVNLVDTTELNTMVIDIKNDSGEVTYNMDLPMVREIGANGKYISDMQELITTLKAKDIYLIARVVAFKDPILAKNKPELSIKNADGSIFKDKSGLAWVNPYKREVWEYLLDISKEAAKLGFDEIQFDYIRFSTDKGIRNVNFGNEAATKSKLDIITEFTKYASETLKPLGVYVSADVYGAIIDSDIDAKIVGQNYVEMSKHLDYISPMVYPSHYADGSYGIPHPDLEPYNLILKSMEASKTVLDEIPEGENKAIVRPWLQDFTASWLKHYKRYNGKEIKDQIKAVYDIGYEEWILWNGSNNYTESGLELVK